MLLPKQEQQEKAAPTLSPHVHKEVAPYVKPNPLYSYTESPAMLICPYRYSKLGWNCSCNSGLKYHRDRRKFSIIVIPLSVMMLSGWNCTPCKLCMSSFSVGILRNEWSLKRADTHLSATWQIRSLTSILLGGYWSTGQGLLWDRQISELGFRLGLPGDSQIEYQNMPIDTYIHEWIEIFPQLQTTAIHTDNLNSPCDLEARVICHRVMDEVPFGVLEWQGVCFQSEICHLDLGSAKSKVVPVRVGNPYAVQP